MGIVDIDNIKQKIKNEEYELTFHAIEMRLARKISTADIEYAIISDEIIEEYPDDYPYPSCLICGKTTDNRPLHVVCAIAPVIKIITIYIPDEYEWINSKIRR